MKKNKEREWVFLLPGILLFTVWPCIVHMDNVLTGLEDEPWFPDITIQGDLFMHVRSVALIILAVWMCLILMDRALLQRKVAFSWKWLWPLLGYLFLTVCSGCFSINRSFSLSGVLEQYETVWVTLAYGVVFLYFAYFMQEPGNVRWIFVSILSGAAVQGCIGISQIAGHDFWSTAAGRWLILLGTDSGQALEYTFAENTRNRVYLSFYNPNYAGVYLILVIPIAAAGIFCFQKLWQKAAAFILTAVLLVCLWESGSRAGLAALAVMGLAGGVLWMARSSRRVITMAVIAFLAIAGVTMFAVLPEEIVNDSVLSGIIPMKIENSLKNVELLKDSVHITFEDKELYLKIEEEGKDTWFSVTDPEGSEYLLTYEKETGYYTLEEMKEPKPRFHAYMEENTSRMIMYWGEIPWEFVKKAGEAGYEYRTIYGKADIPENAPYMFGEGYERVMSSRVYLWSRTLPLVKDYFLLGSGPNTFSLVFPQNDYVMRANISIDMLSQVISRPHNLYLQTAVQTGVPSLVLLLIFFGRYIVMAGNKITGYSIKDLKSKEGQEAFCQKCLETAVFLGALGFLIMGFANDSIVVTSPLFWGILGMGCAPLVKDFSRQRPEKIKK